MTAPPATLPIYYGERSPSPALGLQVAAFWSFRVAPGIVPAVHVIPPDGCVSIFVDSRRRWAALVGPHTEPQKVPIYGGERVWGARIVPGAAGALLTVTPRSLLNRVAPLDEVGLAALEAPILDAFSSALDELDEEEAARRWEAILVPGLAARPEPDRAVLVAAHTFVQAQGDASISEVASALGLSPRQLRRRFQQGVGLSPKEFARLRRVRSSIAQAVLAGNRSWTEIAADRGFSDQAHMVREIRRLLGLAPRELRAYLAGVTHGPIIDR